MSNELMKVTTFDGTSKTNFKDYKRKLLAIGALKGGFDEALRASLNIDPNNPNLLTVDRVLHEINLLKLDSLLRKITDEMIEKGMYTESIKVLAPLLLATKDVYLDVVSGDSKESERAASIELSALNVLMSSCEKAEPMDIQIYLNCHRRKLQMLTVAAGMIGLPASQKDKSLLSKTSAASDLDISELTRRQWIHMLVEEVKDISQSATQVKNFIDQNDTYVSYLVF